MPRGPLCLTGVSLSLPRARGPLGFREGPLGLIGGHLSLTEGSLSLTEGLTPDRGTI